MVLRYLLCMYYDIAHLLQRDMIDPNQSQVCILLSLMYIVAIDINLK